MTFLVLVFTVVSIATGCAGREPSAARSEAPAPGPSRDARGMLAVTPQGRTLVLEVAESPEERARGLMGRPEVPSGTGMWFGFDAPARHSFWMKNCLTALDILWLDERGVIVHVAANVPPCTADPCPDYEPPVPASQVIELGPGEAGRLGLAPGARVMLQRIAGARSGS